MGFADVAASLEPKLLHLLLGLFVGFALSVTCLIVLLDILTSSKFLGARRGGNQRAHDQLDDINTILDEELEKLISAKDDHAMDNTECIEELLKKVRDRCDHGLAMLQAKQVSRYTALSDEFEKKVKMEKDEAEARFKMEKQKHREEMRKLEEEVREIKEKCEAMRWK